MHTHKEEKNKQLWRDKAINRNRLRADLDVRTIREFKATMTNTLKALVEKADKMYEEKRNSRRELETKNHMEKIKVK